MSFKNKVVIVTGSSAGIGAAAAIRFAEEGANVVITGRNKKRLAEVTFKVSKTGNKSITLIADVSKDEDAKRIVDQTIVEFGKIDVLVNNAGFMRSGNILNGTVLAAFDDIVGTNLRAAIHMVTLVAKYVIETKGSIVNVSSVASLIPLVTDGFMAYSVCKAGLDHFMRCAATELSARGVRINNLNPGPVNTGFVGENLSEEERTEAWDIFGQRTSLKRVSTAEEVANLVLFLASDKAQSITGTLLVADNGIALPQIY